MLEIKILEQKIETVTLKDHTRGTVGAKVKITFDDFWMDYEKKVVFKRCYDALSEPVNVLVSGMSVIVDIPPETLAESGKYKIGVVGIKDGVVLPTLYSEEFNSLFATDTKGKSPDKYTPSEFDQLRLQKQDKLTAGVGISISENNVISANSGTIKFKTVAELPDVGEENVIYLVPATDTKDKNLYDEYIYTNGTWEKIGATSVEVDLTEYVKNTDIEQNYNAESTNALSGVAVAQALATIDGIKTITSESVRVWNLEQGIYKVPANTTIHAGLETQTWLSFTLSSDNFMFVSEKVSGTPAKCFTVMPTGNTIDGMIMSYGIAWENNGQKSAFNLYHTVTTNTTQNIDGAKTFTAQPKMTATLVANDNSTNIPNTAWVQNELAPLIERIAALEGKE